MICDFECIKSFFSLEQFEIATRERNLEVLQLGPHGITIYSSKEVLMIKISD